VNLPGTLSISEAKNILWDVVVTGAGVAGGIASREMARAGKRVLLVDKRHFPRRKVCGACLNGAALDVLEQLGLSSAIDALAGPQLHAFALGRGLRTVNLPLPGGRAISREALDATLIREAIAAGVEFLPDTNARVGCENATTREVRLTQNGHESCLEARAIIVASGLEGLGLQDSEEWKTRVGRGSRLGAGCTIEDDSENYAAGTIWMAVGSGGYVGLVRVEDGRLNIAAAFDRQFLRLHGSPGAAAAQLLGTTSFPVPRQFPNAEWQGTIPLTRSTTPVASRRVFLIGDAAAYVEPFTGEGMAWALVTGQHVAHWVGLALAQPAWSRQVARGWCQEHRHLVRNRQRFCRVSTRLLRSKILMAIGFSALASWPWLARFFIERMNAPTHGRLAHECRS